MASPWVSMFKCSSSYEDPGHWVGAQPNPVGPCVNLVTSAKTVVPKKVPITVLGLGFQHLLLGDTDLPVMPWALGPKVWGLGGDVLVGEEFEP